MSRDSKFYRCKACSFPSRRQPPELNAPTPLRQPSLKALRPSLLLSETHGAQTCVAEEACAVGESDVQI